MREPSLAAKLGAEFLGTFVLVFGGCGAAVLAAQFLTEDSVQLGIGFVGVSLALALRLRVTRWPCPVSEGAAGEARSNCGSEATLCFTTRDQ